MQTGNQTSTWETIKSYLSFVGPFVNLIIMIVAFNYTSDLKESKDAFASLNEKMGEMYQLLAKQGRDMDYVMKKLDADDKKHDDFDKTDKEMLERLHRLEIEQIKLAK